MNNSKIALVDIWGTILLERNVGLNEERARILYQKTKEKTILFWKIELEKNIKEFKKQEKRGYTISAKKRIKQILTKNNIYFSNKKIKQIIDEFDNLILTKYLPELNSMLCNNIISKFDDIVLVSNTGLTTKKCTVEILKKLKFYNYIKDMYFSEDYKYCKPNLKFFKMILKKLEVSNKDVIFIGDSFRNDYKPCSRLKIKCYLVSDYYEKFI